MKFLNAFEGRDVEKRVREIKRESERERESESDGLSSPDTRMHAQDTFESPFCPLVPGEASILRRACVCAFAP